MLTRGRGQALLPTAVCALGCNREEACVCTTAASPRNILHPCDLKLGLRAWPVAPGRWETQRSGPPRGWLSAPQGPDGDLLSTATGKSGKSLCSIWGARACTPATPGPTYSLNRIMAELQEVGLGRERFIPKRVPKPPQLPWS